MNIGITGARGRLGRSLRKHFEDSGHRVIAFSRNEDLMHASLTSLGDFVSRDELDWILHAAWSTVPSTAEKSPGGEWIHDLPLLSKILQILLNKKRYSNGKTTPKLLFLSTCSVYGEMKLGGSAFDESMTVSPIGWYASGKVAAENLIANFGCRNDLHSLILRVSNPYGFIQEKHFSQGVIPAMLVAALENKPFSMWGRGDALKDYLHIDDFCRGVESAMSASLQGIFNLASGQSVTVLDVIAKVVCLTGRQIEQIHKEECPWDVKNAVYSVKNLQTHTGWVPKIFLEEGLQRLIKNWPALP
jgi:UDP-glucose 4-epimerase